MYADRWDDPLIELREDEDTPFEAIAEILLFQAKKSKDPVSTKSELKLDSNYLFEVDKIVQRMVDQIMEKQQDSVFQLGNPLSFERCKEKLVLNQNISLINLKKVKQQFSNMLKLHPPLNLEAIEDNFLFFLQKQLDLL